MNMEEMFRTKQKNFNSNNKNLTQKGYQLDPLEGKDFLDTFLGGKKVREYVEDGIKLSELQSYKPIDPELIYKKKFSFIF